MAMQQNHNKGFYQELFETYKEQSFFNIYTLLIYYLDQESIRESNNCRNYRLTKVEFIGDTTTEEGERLNIFVESLNKQIHKNGYSDGSWQLFYLYKSLFQFAGKKYNYFRGQSNNQPLKPGILRPDISDEYLYNFEEVYKELAKKYPSKLNYYQLTETDSRECELSLLQHYGLPTSLLDVTSNVYIAMLFMLGQPFTVCKQPSLFLFNIDSQTHSENHLFSTVKKSNLNERINAQQGAFFNFDKISRLLPMQAGRNRIYEYNGKPNLIDTIKIELVFDRERFNYEVEENLKLIQYSASEGKSNKGVWETEKELAERKKENINTILIATLEYIRDELNRKLGEYGYVEQNLYPDFEKRLEYIRKSYPKHPDTSFNLGRK